MCQPEDYFSKWTDLIWVFNRVALHASVVRADESSSGSLLPACVQLSHCSVVCRIQATFLLNPSRLAFKLVALVFLSNMCLVCLWLCFDFEYTRVGPIAASFFKMAYSTFFSSDLKGPCRICAPSRRAPKVTWKKNKKTDFLAKVRVPSHFTFKLALNTSNLFAILIINERKISKASYRLSNISALDDSCQPDAEVVERAFLNRRPRTISPVAKTTNNNNKTLPLMWNHPFVWWFLLLASLMCMMLVAIFFFFSMQGQQMYCTHHPHVEKENAERGLHALRSCQCSFIR